MLAGVTESAYASKFVALRPLAIGGMAEILLGRVKGASPERLVVLKRLHRHLAADPDHVQMFMDEARLATTLRHSNVVEVYEFGEDGDHFYIVMEYLHGHDLRRVLSEMAKRSVSIRLGHALTIITGVCRGLDYTHERTNASGELLGIVHRDVSPHNVLLTFNGGVKLLDFGIAKAASQISRTRTGILKGKVAYMSPEQAMGEGLDRRSDVFCIGILLWEMTTGQWLYRRKSELETLKAVVESDAPLPSQVHVGYPRELEQIVMKTLARKREDRWSTAGELADALTEFASRQRLNLAPAMLGRMMMSLFSEDVASWQDARRAGATLGDHLVAELEREERKAAGARRITGEHGDRPDDGSGSANANTVFGKRITVDDFDSPTVDHSPDDLAQLGARELEDEPTTVHSPQRAAQLLGQPVPPARPSPALPLKAPLPEPRPPPAQSDAPPGPSPRRQSKRTHVVPTLPPSSSQSWKHRAIGRSREALHWLTQERVPRRWLWLAASAVLALLAAVWLVATLLHRDAEPPSKPAAPAAPSAAGAPTNPTPAAAAPANAPPATTAPAKPWVPAPDPGPASTPPAVVKPPAATTTPPAVLAPATTSDAVKPPTPSKSRPPRTPRSSSKDKAADPGTADAKADSKAADPKAADSKAADSKAADPKAADPKAPDAKGPDAKASDAKASDAKAADPKAPDAKAHDAKASDTKASDTKAHDAKASDAKAPDAKPPDAKAPDTKAKPGDGRSAPADPVSPPKPTP